MSYMRRVMWVALFTMAGAIVCYALAAFSGSADVGAKTQEREGLINFLSQSPKISADNSPLSDFSQGATTARVIVNLVKPAGPAGVAAASAFKDMEGRKQLAASVSAALDRVIASLNPGEIRITNRFTYVFGFSAEVTLEGLQELVDSNDVVSVEQDQLTQAHLAQGIPLMNASSVRNTYNGSGVAIAVCDTGVDYTHPRLGGGGFPNSKVIGGYNTGDDNNIVMDQQGHGTCCSGILAGNLGTVGDYIGGVAYNAKLYILKIVSGGSGTAQESDELQAWEWCITHQNDNPSYPIKIISMSFGGQRYTSNCDSHYAAMTTAAQNANAAGITIFVSSGNDGYCNALAFPSCISYVNSVGAVYDAAIGSRGWCIQNTSCIGYSSGTCSSTNWRCDDNAHANQVICYSNSASFLTLFASSNDAYTTDIVGAGGEVAGDYDPTFGGTSAACPYAAGAAACLQSAAKAITGSFLTAAQVRQTLVSTGDLITDPKATSITKPRVNLGNAIATLGGVTPKPDLVAVDVFPGNASNAEISTISEGQSVNLCLYWSIKNANVSQTFRQQLWLDGSPIAYSDWSGNAGTYWITYVQWTATAGWHTLKGMVDSLGQIDESDESNNVREEVNCFYVSPPPYSVTVSVDRSDLSASGDSFRMWASVPRPITSPCYVFFRIVSPYYGTYYMTARGKLLPYPAPYVPYALTVSAPISNYYIGGLQWWGLKPGTYYLETGAVDAYVPVTLSGINYMSAVYSLPLNFR